MTSNEGGNDIKSQYMSELMVMTIPEGVLRIKNFSIMYNGPPQELRILVNFKKFGKLIIKSDSKRRIWTDLGSKKAERGRRCGAFIPLQNQFYHCNDLYNGSVGPGDVITIGSIATQPKFLKVIIDFEFKLGQSRVHAEKAVRQLVDKSSVEPYEASEEDKNQLNDDWYNFDEDNKNARGGALFYEDSLLYEFERILQA